MRIGFDARWFFRGNPSGRVIVRSLIEQFSRKFSEHDFYFFLDWRDRNSPFPFQGDHSHPVYVRGGSPLIANVFFIPPKARKLNLDVVIFHYFAPPNSGFKRVLLIHDAIFFSHPHYFTLRERLYFAPIRPLARRADRLVSLSHSEKRRLENYGFAPADRIDVVPLGVGKRFQPRQNMDPAVLRAVQQKFDLPDRFLLYAGRLNQRKNLGNLLRAVALLADRDIPLLLTGTEDWMMFDLQRLIQKLGLERRVIRTGGVSDEELAALYALSTIFCYVSFEEGFGLPPLEAMACGVPVVVSRAAAVAEVCGQAGTYADAHSAREIARRIDELLGDPGLFREKSEAGIRRASQFRWETTAERLIESCRKTISGN